VRLSVGNEPNTARAIPTPARWRHPRARRRGRCSDDVQRLASRSDHPRVRHERSLAGARDDTRSVTSARLPTNRCAPWSYTSWPSSGSR